jgi:CheY-like chemotaxis protein
LHFPFQIVELAKDQLNAGMAPRPKILLLDDDEDVLELYREMFRSLPSQPEIHTATSGARAISLLEGEPFHLLISDLNMPRVDGLQVLTIVRRKFPQLRTAVLTAVADEQFRMRAYAMGIDLFLEKPNNHKEIVFLLDCVESLLGAQQANGFRGVQSKGLVDIIQLECLSQSSSVLRIINTSNQMLHGRVWIQQGAIIDAEVSDLTGSEAFQKILSWKTGHFEILPPEPGRPQRITTSYQGLLLETAQAIDEKQTEADQTTGAIPPSKLTELGQFNGVEYAVEFSLEDKKSIMSWGLEEPEETAQWKRETIERFRDLGESLQAGPLVRMEATGPGRQFSIWARAENYLCVGFHRSVSPDLMRETMKKIVAKWAS